MPESNGSLDGKPTTADGVLRRQSAATAVSREVQACAAEACATFARYDDAAGWPPRIAGCKEVTKVAPKRWQAPFPPRLQRQYVDAALRHPDVRPLMTGRSELLGCHLVDHKHRPTRAHCVRVVFANYTARHLVEVHLRELRVESVARRPSHGHPEAAVEMAQAIALARGAPELGPHVQGLRAHAILQMPSPQSPYREDRCLLVTFTDEDDPHVERPALFSAVVDLNLQQVLRAGRCPCSGG